MNQRTTTHLLGCAALVLGVACSDDTSNVFGGGNTGAGNTGAGSSVGGANAGGANAGGNNTAGGTNAGGNNTAGGNAVGGGGVGGGNLDCGGACPQGTFCDSTLGCVFCLTDGDCANSPGAPVCAQGACHECGTNTDCGAASPNCNPITFTCETACTNNNQCNQDPLTTCDPNTGNCVMCLADADCPQFAPLCFNGICGECGTNADCGAANPICDTPSATCVQCLVDSQCDAGSVCLAHDCQPGCNTDQDCPNGQTCDVAAHHCVECLTDADCQNGRVCAPFQQCVECITTADCAGDGICQNFSCVGG